MQDLPGLGRLEKEADFLTAENANKEINRLRKWVRHQQEMITGGSTVSEKQLRLIKAFGDKASNVLEQMGKGNWTDDHGHDVRLNLAMIELAETLEKATDFMISHYRGSAQEDHVAPSVIYVMIDGEWVMPEAIEKTATGAPDFNADGFVPTKINGHWRLTPVNEVRVLR